MTLHAGIGSFVAAVQYVAPSVADASGFFPSFGDSLECQRIDIHKSTTILFVLKDEK
jgi:hypothetical protein